jgi:hypothetical protein
MDTQDLLDCKTFTLKFKQPCGWLEFGRKMKREVTIDDMYD